MKEEWPNYLRASDFSVIPDAELDRVVERILSMHPQSGEKTVSSQMYSLGPESAEVNSMNASQNSQVHVG